MMGNHVFNIAVIFVSLFVVLSRQENSAEFFKAKWLTNQQTTQNVKNAEVEQISNGLINLKISKVTRNDNYSVISLEEYSSSNNTEENGKIIHNKQRRNRIAYIPFARYDIPKDDLLREEECVPNSSDEFPADIFTPEQKKHGAVILHFILGIYCFTLLAVVCNDYFLPSVELICEVLHLSQDVAAATFMAIATSAPEFFVNVIGTFVTKSDIGVGTVVGSAMFNTLGVAALGGLAASKPIQIHWWPITRDSIIYVLVLIMLIVMCRDGEIQWYEAMILLICYFLYFFIMWANAKLKGFVKRISKKIAKSKVGSKKFFTDEQCSSVNSISTIQSVITQTSVDEARIDIQNTHETKDESNEENDVEYNYVLFQFPKNVNWVKKVWFVYSWPIRLLLICTIPNCKKRPNLFPITFLMCVAWIGSNSYLVSWMITVIAGTCARLISSPGQHVTGNTLGVPDFVMGLTFLAAGGCLPEAISIVIVSRKGHGGMGVSNSLGANTLDILMCLGLPWFISVMVNDQKPILLGADSLFYTITALLLAVVALYTTLTLFRYRLFKKVGFILITIYCVFLTAAILLEILGVGDEDLKPCE